MKILEKIEDRLAPGTIVAERYRVESQLGEGGMGVVYLAEHVHMRKRVALKVLLRAWCSTPEVVARFEREAVAAGSIDHPHVACATDSGKLPDGSFFLVLEYVAGDTLRCIVDKGPTETARAVHITRGILEAVGAAHARGVVHRDLKPENIMLVERDGDNDFVKVLDFGIAKVMLGDSAPPARAGADGGEVLTRMGAVLGTPDYMAPEQALGQSVDGRADLYAVGVILYEMLTGQCPFRGGAVTVLRQHVLEAAPSLTAGLVDKVDPRIQAVVTKLLQKDPKQRYSTAAEVIAAIDDASRPLIEKVPRTVLASPLPVSAMTLPAETQTAAASLVRHVTRRRVIVAAVSLAVVATALIASVARSRLPESSTGPATASSSQEPDMELDETDGPEAVPSASAAASSAPPAAASGRSPAPRGPAKGVRKRRTGPGGIYIPPPRNWFK